MTECCALTRGKAMIGSTRQLVCWSCGKGDLTGG